MRQTSARFSARVIVLLALAPAAVTFAQGQAAPALVHNSDRRASALEKETTRKREPKEVLVEVNQDLGRLKELSDNISSYLAATSNAPNYKYISESVAEIKKRSTRLRASLALPRDENEGKSAAFKDAEKGELEPALAALNKLLDGFLHNPIFSDTTIDMQLAAKAARDLRDIIVLSEKLRKNAEKRNKLVGKTI